MYTNYQKAILECLQNPEGFENFKHHPEYIDMLEHVSPKLGLLYLKYTCMEFPILFEEILGFCELNDKIGNAIKYEYNSELKCSPTSIRYIYQAHLILKHIQSLQLETVNIVEVGCGYGGLCLAINYFSNKFNININQYNLIDLEEPSLLQKLYLDKHNLLFPCNFYDAKNYGKEITNENLYFISNYCFTEIDSTHQKLYIKHLLPKCNHGFLVWNSIEYYDIGKEVKIEEERPQTDMAKRINKFVYF